DGPRRLPRRPRRLGPGRPWPGQRGHAGEHPGLRCAVGGAPAHDAHRDGSERRAAGGPDGQLGGRPPQPRGRRDRPAGPRAHRRRRRGRVADRQRGAPGDAARRAPPAPDRPGVRRRRALLRPPPPCAARAVRGVGARRRRRARLHGRPRHRADRRREVPRRAAGLVRGGRDRAHRIGGRALLRDGPRQALGPRPEGLRPARPRPRRAPCRQRRRGRPGGLRPRRDGRVHRADDGRRGGRDPPGRRRPGLQLPPRPDARADARARRPGLRRGRPRGRRARRALLDPDGVRGGLAVRRRLPAAPAADDDRPRDRRARPGPAPRRRDGEVPARDVLLQRRGGDGLPGGGARPRPLINFANADMVGHTGSIPAAIAAVETVDECLGRVLEAVAGRGGACLVTADHGNADHMLEPDGSPNTAHSLNPVPFVVTGAGALDGPGILADVAPTALALLGIEQPAEM
ncbi:MAG: 2,3-bisphosphoglycerate-independent phosphoglycerate mutase, partial [uncultured Solirubrobacteraceae bacterium]